MIRELGLAKIDYTRVKIYRICSPDFADNKQTACSFLLHCVSLAFVIKLVSEIDDKCKSVAPTATVHCCSFDKTGAQPIQDLWI